eukprot:UN28815
MDGSTSIVHEDWETSRIAASLFLGVFADEIPSLQASVYSFDSHIHKESELDFDIKAVNNTINEMQQHFGATDYALALDSAHKEFDARGQDGSFKCVVMISDGAPTQSMHHHTANPAQAIQKASLLKNNGTTIVGIIVTAQGVALKKVSSCVNDGVETPNCEYFFAADNWDEFLQNSEDIAEDIVFQVGNVENETCDASPWLWFLLLLLPLLFVLLAPLFANTKKEY